ncbi:phosphotyrosine protein phosphatase I superfamily [Blyttiomyces helicus]|uniref:Phosphotyrosine protein phosphatase I superfamily n=1 Tax=Blyttiomyces helicus TaxID=388810 RepID=A0A4V1IPI3_9FUNG|nr:phosphotyrosine protein phosphatase I superfamily [Blyttiomyces helicus]|eukprot:RKO83157.1 phosphotyrosine protein phosphatase I superfamily [Blyttiomyces helicus]
MTSTEKTSVLFVCLGNICRSPMAEAVFRHVVTSRGLSDRFVIDSAGTAGYHVGDSPDPRSVATCRKNGVPVSHSGQKVNKEDFSRFDYILCMDESNLADLKRLQPTRTKAKVSLFGDFDPKGDRIIKDPYYGGQDGFDRNYAQVVRCSEGFLKSLGV